ncbi:hypothetical protein SEA_CHARM_43 [Mycobacterium phage Charm]|nr:hypothetical protein SEA_CHARM_43 [Mycobacterium phage Charm]QGJ88323.1 hypothetical protein SEA_DREAMTEAM1_43 [Mycobacterium phage DreamTeam1]
MIFEVSNAHSDLKGQVRVTIDTTYDNALEILAAASEIANRPDPILAAITAGLREPIYKDTLLS